jgi:CHU_C Type IX secretion signal domain
MFSVTRLRRVFTFCILTFLYCSAFAQRVDCSNSANCSDPFCAPIANDGLEKGCECFDGIDNDGDLQIDQADLNCASYYGLEFIGEGSDCSITPPGASTPFELIGPPAVSGQNTADTQSKVAVGDVDGDGIPDAVITSKWNSEIRVVATSDNQPDGSDAGDIKGDYNLDGSKIFSGSGACNPKNLLFEHEVLIADIDKDGMAEIFGVVSNRQGNPKSPPTCFFLVGFRYGKGPGGLQPLYNAIQIGTDRPGTFGIADMDGDGKAEIYMRDRIYAAETGALLATGNGNWDLDISSQPVAVNLAGSSQMELVCGVKIFRIDNISLTNRNPASPQTLTVLADMNATATDKCYVKLMLDPVEYGLDTHSGTSVADIDGDGNIDIIVSGALNSPSGKTAVFYWNYAKDIVSYYLPPDPTYANGWPWGTGRVNLKDINNDHLVDLFFIAGNQLFCLETDASGGTMLNPTATWVRTINDSRSGVLTVTIYDFDNNGSFELVYRDSQELAVIDAETGTTKYWSVTCQSHTYTEGPVIADVNGDGATDICVTCNRNNSFNINADIQQQALGEIRLFFSNGNEWLPTRKVWNQPGYFIVNINDDLTLPFPQYDQYKVFSNDECSNGLSGPQQPLNVFLNQVPYLSSNGCPVFPAPDLAFVGDDPENLPYPPGDPRNFPAVIVTPPICGNLDVGVQFNFINDGDLPITDAVPVSFFHGDPTSPTITGDSLLYSTVLNVVNLQVGDTVTTAPVTFSGPGTPFRLYIVLNNNGSVLPIDPGGSVSNECRIDNNIYDVLVVPSPFTATIEKIKDNFKCSDTAPDVGELSAHIFKGTVETFDYSPYAFEWRDASNVVVSTQYNATGLPEGDYTLIVTNTAKGCSSEPVTETIFRLGTDPEITVNVNANQTKCNPPDGIVEAQIVGGTAGYDFVWLNTALDTVAIGTPIVQNLPAGNYFAIVTAGDGCSEVTQPVSVLDPMKPDAQAQVLKNVVDCIDVSSGSITADALFNGVAQPPANYTFDWYFYDNSTATRGSILPPANGTGPTRTDLDTGYYQVAITDINTQCVANQMPIVQVTDATVLPTALLVELNPQTSCDPANPNGRVQANVEISGIPQDPSNFTFEWFKGDNTLPVNLHTNVSGVNGSVAEGVSGGGSFYTVKVTTATNCSDTEKLIISENVNVPQVTLMTTGNSICDPLLASSNYNGSVAASVTFDGAAVTDFSNYELTWYQGPQTTDPVIPVTTPSLAEQESGYYTLVVERTDLFCTSNPETAEVKDITILPSITANGIPSTNCDPALANGSVEVTDVDGVGTPSNYTYEWSAGSTPSGLTIASAPASPDTLQGSPGKFYTVSVTNTITGCQNSSTVEVGDDSTLPTIDLVATDNTICSGTPDGTASLNSLTYGSVTENQPSAFPGYSFSWSSGEATTDISQKPAGTYSLVVTRDDVGCRSDEVEIDIQDDLVIPAILTSETPQTSCDPTDLNGHVDASVDVGGMQVTAGYSFGWFTGSNTNNPLDPANVDPVNSFSAIDLPGGVFYTLEVTNDATQCVNTSSVFVPEIIAYPRLELNVTDIVDCNNPGFITANIFVDLDNDGVEDPLPAGGYTDYAFSWHRGSSLADPLLSNTTGRLLEFMDDGMTPIPPSNYTSVAVNTYTKCETSDVTVLLNDPPPLFDILTNPNFIPASCAADEGVITAFVDNGGGGTTAGYSFEWYDGNITNAIQNPPPSFYTDPPVMFNGSPLAIDPQSLYNTPAFPAGKPLPNHQAPTSANMGPTLYGRPSGTYTVVATRASDGCKEYVSSYLPFQDEPVIIVAEIKPDDCLGDNGEIAVDIMIPGANTPDNYKIWMIPGSNPTLSPPSDPVGAVGVVDPAAATGNTFSGLGPGVYTVVAQEDPTDIPTGCFSSPVQIEMREALPPFLDILGASFSTSCGIAPGDGSLELTFQTDPNDPFSPTFPAPSPPVVFNPGPQTYNVDVLDRNGASVFSNNGYASGTTLTIPNLKNGKYNVTITSSQGCKNSKDYIVPWDPQVAQLVNGDVIKADPIYCDPALEANARIEVTNISIIGGGPDNIGDYQFDWYTDIGLTSNVYSDIGDPSATVGGETLENNSNGVAPGTVKAGSYWVVATKVNAGVTGGLGCFSAPFKVELKSNSIKPAFTLLPFSNSACDANFDGRLQLTVTSPGSVPTPTYTYDWDNNNPTDIEMGGGPVGNNDGDGDGSDGDGDNPASLGSGVYKVTVVNDASGCATTKQATILKTAVPVITLSTQAVDQMICNPDGSITVVDVAVDGISDPNHSNFDFSWYVDDPTSAPVINAANGADLLNSGGLPTFGGGTYYVKARRTAGIAPGSGCESAPVKAVIKDLSVDPDMSFVFLPNSSCNALNPNGSVTATAIERDGTSDAYTFSWALGGNPLPPITTQTDTSPTSQLDNVSEGNYTLLVTNTSTGCTFTKSLKVNLDQSISLPNIITVDTNDPMNCLGSGDAEVTAISIGGGPPITGAALGTDFVYEWYVDDFVPANLAAETSPQFSNLDPAKYFVLVEDIQTNCKSDPTEVVILPNSIVYPFIQITQTKMQLSCLGATGTASLVATANGQSDVNPNYSFNWFNNLDAAPPAFALTSTIANLVAGDYSVSVIDASTGCSASKLYIVEDESGRFTPRISLSSIDRVNCLAPDGSIITREVGYVDNFGNGYPYPPDFTAEYYLGLNPDLMMPGNVMAQSNQNGFVTNWVQGNMDIGTITVKITDNNTGCIVSGLIDIQDGRTSPLIEIVQENPLINCDPVRLNGQLSASADGGKIGGYTFDWYIGSNATGGVITTSNKLIGQGSGQYTVRVTNDQTGCFDNAVGQIMDGRVLPPSPTAVLIQDRTDCINPDGWVAANVNGATINYIFRWFDGPASQGSPDFVGSNYTNRDSGPYTVTAEDIITGCISLPAAIEVADKRVYPELYFTTTPSYCEDVPTELGGGKGTGSITVQLEPADLIADDVVWTYTVDNSIAGTGSYITDLYPGLYHADAVTSKGCPGDGQAEVKTEIRSYNLVTVNGDQKNDKFIIDCISRFPNNNVKIFNRSGILVYEADRYDNGDIVFDGIGEKGLYIGGNLLPVGTYFYIIDKRDGSKPKSGYLELVR